MSHLILRSALVALSTSALFLLSGCGGLMVSLSIAQTADYKSDGEETLVWADEFDGTVLKLAKWKFETGASGWGNHEWQNYTNQGNVVVSDGTLKISAKLVGEGQKVGDYTSARLNSVKKFTYGRMEVRAKMPELKGKGVWPAIWMLGEDLSTVSWPKCGEIDIVEYVSYQPDNVHFNLHSEANNHIADTNISSGPVKLETAEEEFHKYGIVWTPTKLSCYLDDPKNVTVSFDRPKDFNQDNWPFDKPFYFLLNVAVGGDWGGKEGVEDSIFPSTMEVDYVRVYQNR